MHLIRQALADGKTTDEADRSAISLEMNNNTKDVLRKNYLDQEGVIISKTPELHSHVDE